MMMTTIRTKRYALRSFASAMLLLAASPGAALADGVADNTVAAGQPFPAQAARYKGKLFELIDPDEAKYDAAFARSFDAMLAPYAKLNRGLRNRITSGPTANSSYVQAGADAYVYFGICQAHQCDNTTMDILFNPSKHKMVGKLLDRCKPVWLGSPDAAEQALLNARHEIAYPATSRNCGAAQ